MSEFFKELDRREAAAKTMRLSERPENLHDYQGCARDVELQTCINYPCQLPKGHSGPCSSTDPIEACDLRIMVAPELFEDSGGQDE